jgi:hypothetical protein
LQFHLQFCNSIYNFAIPFTIFRFAQPRSNSLLLFFSQRPDLAAEAGVQQQRGRRPHPERRILHSHDQGPMLRIFSP